MPPSFRVHLASSAAMTTGRCSAGTDWSETGKPV